MDSEKRAALEAAGFRVSTVTEFLGLSPEEELEVERRVEELQENRKMMSVLMKKVHELAMKYDEKLACTDELFWPTKMVIVNHEDGTVLRYTYASLMRLTDPEYLSEQDLAAQQWYARHDELYAEDPDREDIEDILGEEPSIMESAIGWLVVFSEHHGMHVFACGDLKSYAQYERVYEIPEFPLNNMRNS